VLEALVALTMAHLALQVFPFAWIVSAAGHAGAGRADDRSRRVTTDPVALNVRRALRAGARRLPWRATCLTKALAGKMMLVRRGTPSTLVFGVAADGRTVSAHAWLTTATGTVCGSREAQRFRPLAVIRS
jgi:hypothetical protein